MREIKGAIIMGFTVVLMHFKHTKNWFVEVGDIISVILFEHCSAKCFASFIVLHICILCSK